VIFTFLFGPLRHIAIAKLKIEMYKDKITNETERKVLELENECLGIRCGELCLETMPQLIFQFATLSTRSVWEQG